jgi:hypothetical protein
MMMAQLAACGGGGKNPTAATAPTPLPADFQLNCTPSSFSNLGCGNGVCSVTANAQFDGTVEFRCSGVPTGVACSLGPASLRLGANQVGRTGLTVGLSPVLVGGTVNVQVTASGGGVTKAATIGLSAPPEVALPRTSGSWMVVQGCAGYRENLPNPGDLQQYRQVIVVAAGCTQVLSEPNGAFEMTVSRNCFPQGTLVDLRAGGLNSCAQVPFAVGGREWIDVIGRSANSPCP